MEYLKRALSIKKNNKFPVLVVRQTRLKKEFPSKVRVGKLKLVK